MYADGLHGGVKYSAELGQYLNTLGYNVYMCGVVTNDKIKNFLKQNDIKLFNVSEMPTDIYFDLVWAHHWPILPYLIKRGIKYKYLINSCISRILLVERPIWFWENIDLCLTLTQEAKELFCEKYDIPNNKIEVLPNTAPDIFFNYKTTINDTPKKIAVVSNHIPEEIFEAIELLKQKNIDIAIYGSQTQSVDITPNLLSKYDVVITIGKTVQYSLAMGIPVYNYDHFGGNGYITIDNIYTEEKFTFSGRSSFCKKTPHSIVNEIFSHYDSVKKQRKKLHEIAKERYQLSTRINQILNKIYSSPPVKHVEINGNNKLLFDYCEFVIDLVAHHNNIKKNITRYQGLKSKTRQQPEAFNLISYLKLRIFCSLIPVKKWRRNARRHIQRRIIKQ